MPVLADDDVVVHGNAERGGDLDDRLGHVDVRRTDESARSHIKLERLAFLSLRRPHGEDIPTIRANRTVTGKPSLKLHEL